jgi:hypothetical protein
MASSAALALTGTWRLGCKCAGLDQAHCRCVAVLTSAAGRLAPMASSAALVLTGTWRLCSVRRAGSSPLPLRRWPYKCSGSISTDGILRGTRPDWHLAPGLQLCGTGSNPLPLRRCPHKSRGWISPDGILRGTRPDWHVAPGLQQRGAGSSPLPLRRRWPYKCSGSISTDGILRSTRPDWHVAPVLGAQGWIKPAAAVSLSSQEPRGDQHRWHPPRHSP